MRASKGVQITRQTSLKRTKRGYVRNLGKKSGGGQPKFSLGHDREEAIRRLNLITVLWGRVEERTTGARLPTWTPEEIESAQEIARGESPTLTPGKTVRHFEECVRYVHDIAEGSQATGVQFTPSLPILYEIGGEQINKRYGKARTDLTKAAPETGPPLTGRILHQALDGYRD